MIDLDKLTMDEVLALESALNAFVPVPMWHQELLNTIDELRVAMNNECDKRLKQSREEQGRE